MIAWARNDNIELLFRQAIETWDCSWNKQKQRYLESMLRQ